MKTNRKSLLLIITLVVLLISAVPLPSIAAVPAAVLGIPAGYSASMALVINTSGQIAGMISDDNGTNSVACLWLTNGTPIVLGTLADDPTKNLDYVDSRPNAINSSGQVVGSSTEKINLLERATLWSYDADTDQVEAKDLGTYKILTPSLTQSEALAINDKGQILCRGWTTDVNEDRDDIWYLQDEDGTQTPIELPGGTPINADGFGFYTNPGLLNAEGQVAGIVEIGHWTGASPNVWIHEYDQAVLWTKTATGSETVVISPSKTVENPEPDAMVTAINGNGMVVGSVYTAKGTLPFVYDSTNGYQILTLPPMDSSITQAYGMAMDVNDAGQATVMLALYNSAGSYGQLWIWDNAAGKWTYQLPVASMLPSGDTLSQVLGFINNAGQVAGIAIDSSSSSYTSFLWSASAGIQPLGGTLSESESLAFTINDSGVTIGAVGLSSGIFATAWGLPMTVTNAAAARSKKVISVKVDISNPTNASLTGVSVNTCSLMELYGIDQPVYNSLLPKPISVGSIKAGGSKRVTLQFSTDIPMQTAGLLKLNITSSLGTFDRYALINIP